MLGGNVEQEAPKIESSLGDITNASKKAADAAKAAVQEQVAVIKQIEADMANIEKQIQKAAPGSAKGALVEELGYAKKALAEEKAALNDVNVSIEKTASGHVRLRTQVMEAKDALAKMEMAGLRGTAEYKAQAQVLGELNDQMGDTTAQAKVLADDEKGFKGVASAVSGVAGAMSAAVGAAALFGAENEDLVKIQTRLQAVMAITIGIQQVAETLNKDSYFSQTLLTGAKEMYAATNLKVAATLGISNLAAKALMATLTVGLTIAIGAAIYLWDKYSTAQQKTADEAKEFGKKTAQGIGEPMAKIQSLSDQWDKLGDNLVDKKKFVDDNKDAFKELGVQVNNVADAENLLVANKEAFILSLIAKAKAAAGMELASEKYKLAMEKMLQADKLANTVDVYTSTGGQSNTGGGTMTKSTVKNKTKEDLKKQHADLLAEGDKFIRESDEQAKKAGELLSGAKIVSYKDPEKAAKAVKDKVAKEAYDAEKALQKMLLEIKDQTSKLLLDQQVDSLQKRLNAIDLEKQLEVQKIEEKEVAIVEAYNKSRKGEKGFVPLSTNPANLSASLTTIDPTQAKGIADANLALDAAYAAKRVDATKVWGEELTALAGEFADERVQIETDYNAKIKDLTDKGMVQTAAMATVERNKKVGEVTIGLIQETEAYKLATSDQLQVSKETTEKLIADIKKRVAAELAAGKLTKDQANKMLSELNKAEYTVQKTDNPFADLMDGLEKYKKARDEQSKANSDVSIADLAKMEDAANKAQKATMEASAGALQGISAIISQVTGELKGLTSSEKKTVDEVLGLINGAATLAQGLDTDNPVAIIQGSIELMLNGYKLLDAERKKLDKKIEDNQNAIGVLEVAYDKLGVAIKGAYGTDKVKLIKEEIDNLKKRKTLIEENMAAEQAKTRKPKWYEYLSPAALIANALTKADPEKLKEYQDALDAIAKTEKELEDNAFLEALTGTSVSSAIDEFANAYADAFTSGEDAAAKSAEVVKNILKKALVEDLKKDLDEPIQALMTMVKEAMDDGILTEAEKAAIAAKKKVADDAAASNEQMFTDLGLNDSTAAKGIQGDVKNMTEDTGSALVGQITAMRLNVAEIVVNYKNSAEIMTKQLALQQQIADNTAFCRKLERMDNTLEDIRINGLKIK